MGEMLAIGVFGLACALVGMIWGVRVGRGIERQLWTSHASGVIDDRPGGVNPAVHADGEWYVVMRQGYFWSEYHNPLVRCRRDHAAGMTTRHRVKA